jgi:hypothetical protein
MTAKDNSETGKTPTIRDLQDDEIDSTSGGVAIKTPGLIDPGTDHVRNPKSPGLNPESPSLIDPNPDFVR